MGCCEPRASLPKVNRGTLSWWAVQASAKSVNNSPWVSFCPPQSTPSSVNTNQNFIGVHPRCPLRRQCSSLPVPALATLLTLPGFQRGKRAPLRGARFRINDLNIARLCSVALLLPVRILQTAVPSRITASLCDCHHAVQYLCHNRSDRRTPLRPHDRRCGGPRCQNLYNRGGV